MGLTFVEVATKKGWALGKSYRALMIGEIVEMESAYTREQLRTKTDDELRRIWRIELREAYGV